MGLQYPASPLNTPDAAGLSECQGQGIGRGC